MTGCTTAKTISPIITPGIVEIYIDQNRLVTTRKFPASIITIILLTNEGTITNGSAIFTPTNNAIIAKQVVEKPKPVIPLTNDAKKNANANNDKYSTDVISNDTNFLQS